MVTRDSSRATGSVSSLAAAHHRPSLILHLLQHTKMKKLLFVIFDSLSRGCWERRAERCVCWKHERDTAAKFKIIAICWYNLQEKRNPMTEAWSCGFVVELHIQMLLLFHYWNKFKSATWRTLDSAEKGWGSLTAESWHKFWTSASRPTAL